MDIKIFPSKLKGEIVAPPSKSISHRAIICAMLSKKITKIKNIDYSKDILATINAIKSLGAKCEQVQNKLIIDGIKRTSKQAKIFCDESGSTLRFLIGICGSIGVDTLFDGNESLRKRNIKNLLDCLQDNGLKVSNQGNLPFEIKGKLLGGDYYIKDNSTSQLISGLLMGLPILNGDSKIIIEKKISSKGYIDITIDVLRRFGVEIHQKDYGYFIKGNQEYNCNEFYIEGDYSNSAFYLVANKIGNQIKLNGLNQKTKQGDYEIVNIINKLNEKNQTIDINQIPDLAPIIAVLLTQIKGEHKIINIDRLRIKESNRVSSTINMINSVGGKAFEKDNVIVIQGGLKLTGGTVDSFNDHRIAMAASIISTICENEVIIKNAQCVEKSYPVFFEKFKKLGGKYDVINVG